MSSIPFTIADKALLEKHIQAFLDEAFVEDQISTTSDYYVNPELKRHMTEAAFAVLASSADSSLFTLDQQGGTK